MVRWLVAVGLVSLVLGLAAGAQGQAQRALVLPVGGDEALVAAHGAAALAALEQALTGAGFGVERSDCREPSCAGELLRAGRGDLAVGLALWPREGGVRASLVLVDAAERQVSGEAEGPAEAAAELAGEALDRAIATWSVREGAPVRVVGAPEGASVTVDRELWGTLPHEGTLPPGEHRFVVSADGFVTERRSVDIAFGGGALELRFDLAREGGDPWPSLVLGGGLVVVGLALTVPGWATLSLDGGCAARDAVGCRSRYAFDGAAAAWLVAGGVAAVGGVVLLATAPIQVHAAPAADGASVGVSGRF